MMSWSTIFVTIFAVLSSSIIAEDPCRFVHSKGVIDITSLGRTDGTPQFQNVFPPTGSNYKYNYNPCEAFSQGSACQNVSACQVSLDGLFQISLGTQESALWNAGADVNSTPSVSYSSAEKNVQVLLQCADAGSFAFEALGEDPINTYKFRLTHKCACWNECDTQSTTTEQTTSSITTEPTTTSTTSSNSTEQTTSSITTEPTTTSTTSSNSTEQTTSSTASSNSTSQTTTKVPEGSGNTIYGGTVFFIILLFFTFVYINGYSD